MLASILGATAGYGAEILGLSDNQKINGKYIVILKQDQMTINAYGSKANMVQSMASSLENTVGVKVEKEFSETITGFSVTADPDQLDELQNNPRVDYIEVDKTFRMNSLQDNPTWGLDRIDQHNLPLDNAYLPDASGENVNVYIIDTGINKIHTEFTGRIAEGYDAIDGDTDPNDCQGHGSHVAGTVAGTLYGVSKKSIVHGVRVLNCQGSGSTSDIIDGIEWVVKNAHGPSVANMSLGGSVSLALDNAVANAVAKGVTFVVAAGNERADACDSSPAREKSAITVGATTIDDSMAQFSNYGTCVDIFAPGKDIESATHNNSNGSRILSGTSMASPHVAGAAALYLDTHVNATPKEVAEHLKNYASKNKISDIGSGSPNSLLYIGDDQETPPEDDVLENGVMKSGLNGQKSSEKYYIFEVPEQATDIEVSIGNGTGDADLYVKLGSKPTLSNYDCRPYLNGNDETCKLDNAGTYYVMIRGYESYTNLSIIGKYNLADENLCSELNEWASNRIYKPGSIIQYHNNKFESKRWHLGVNPENIYYGSDYWDYSGSCSS